MTRPVDVDAPGRTALARVAGVSCRLAALASVPLLAIGSRRLFQLERTSSALAEQQTGETLVTVGAGMLLLGGLGWLLDRRRPAGSRLVTVLATLSVAWPAWIGFVHWYDAR